MRNRHDSRVRRWNCPREVSLHAGGVHHRNVNRRHVSRFHSGRAAMKKLRVAAQAVAICGVIAFMASTKSRGITAVVDGDLNL
jgi:hypothetical protein